MKKAVELIVENAEDHPEFRYYIPIIKKAEKNISNQPDICVETVKALFEGISKSILERLDGTKTRDELNRMEVGPLVKAAVKQLKFHDDVVEDDFVTRCVSLTYSLANLRNQRGDISHGRAVPKDVQSSVSMAFLSFQMAEGIVSYMLDSFYRISEEQKISATKEMSEHSEISNGDSDLEQVKYDGNAEFNELLDQDMNWDGKLKYSQALFELYYEDYIVRLDAYRESLEEE